MYCTVCDGVMIKVINHYDVYIVGVCYVGLTLFEFSSIFCFVMEEKERRERLKNLKTQIDMAGIYTCIT